LPTNPVFIYPPTDTLLVNYSWRQLILSASWAALTEIQGQVNAGTYVQPSTLTVEQACADWLQSRHKIRPTTAAGYEYVLQPLRGELGDLAVQDLTRRHIDELIVKLRAGSLERPGGRARKAWSARSCNSVLGALSQVLGQLVAEGRLARNVAALVDRVPGNARKFETFTADQVRTVLGGIAKDRNRHAWHLALAGLRRGEIAGLRWDDADLGQRTVRIGKTRVDVGGRALDQDDPKTASSSRVLPLPDALLSELAAAKARQTSERLALGEAYAGLGYVMCNEAGEPYHPSTLSTMWPGGNQESRRATGPAARRSPYLCHDHAPSGCADRVGRGLAGPCRRLVHSSDLRTRAARGAGSCGAQLCSADIKLWRLTGSHTRAVTPTSFL
jgi:integrase